MKHLIAALSLLMLSFSALAAEPSTESIERLLQVTEAEKLVASMEQQMDGFMAATMNEALKGKELGPRSRQKLDELTKKTTAILKEEMSWKNTKDIYIQVYRETFTQEEIDGLIRFYESPTGKAFVAKMPLVMNKTMTLMQQRMGPMMQKLQAAMEEALGDMDAAPKGKKGAK